MKARLALGIVAVVAIGLVGRAVYLYMVQRQSINAKETETNMVHLMSILNSDRPLALDEQSILTLLKTYNLHDGTRDGWGNPFVIERSETPNGPRYTIIVPRTRR